MSHIIPQVTETMKKVLTDKANEAAQQTGCVRRERKFSGATFVQTLVLGWLDNPDATLSDLASTAASLGGLGLPSERCGCFRSPWRRLNGQG